MKSPLAYFLCKIAQLFKGIPASEANPRSVKECLAPDLALCFEECRESLLTP